MAAPIATIPSNIQSGTGARGVSVLSTNSSVQTAKGLVILATDLVLFPTGSGQWLQTNQLVLVNGVPTVGATSLGESKEGPNPTVGSMTVLQGDNNVTAM